MRTKKNILLAALFAAAMAGCVTTTTHNTPHPDKGSLQVESYFALRSAESVDPDSLTVIMDTVVIRTDTNVVRYPGTLDPGTHEVLVYNLPVGMEFKDSLISVVRNKENYLVPDPGYLYTGYSHAEIIPDDTLRLKMPLVQRVKRLEFIFKATGGSIERIDTVTGVLKGILGSVNPYEGHSCGKPDSSKIGFNLQLDTLRASCMIAGISPDTTTVFKVRIRFTDGHEQTFETHLDKYLSDFYTNVDKKVFTAKFEAQTNAEYGFIISDWKPTDEYEVDVK